MIKKVVVNMKKLQKHKKDIGIILLFGVIYIIIALILTHQEYLFASKTDFEMQHYLFPEYFRNLFYDTKDLLPDLALNLGGGQNIYNFSYYGLLSPFILFSYLLPMVPMLYYLIGASFIIVISSTFLFYKFLKSHNFKNSTCLMVALLFLFATPIIYHAKRHIMFINYFPFLIGALFGVDSFLKKGKPHLLIACTTLMIFTSFYYSVSAIVVLGVYAIYEYLKNHKIKELFQFLPKLALPFIISILMSAVLLLPTAYTIVSGRGESINAIEEWMLLIPNFKFLWSSYGPGLTLLEFILIALLVIDKEIPKRTRNLALTLTIIFLFPLFNYILNGTLYVNTKSLIPFLPLALFLLAISLETLLKHHKKIKVYLLLSTCIITIMASFSDQLIPKSEKNNKIEKEYESLIKKAVKEDSDFYRIGNEAYNPSSLNRVYDIKEYKSSVYSSTENKKYQNWLQKEINGNQVYRNNMMLTLAGNAITEALMGEKYIVTTKKLGKEYKLIDQGENLYLYENKLALPIIYATTKTLPEEKYQSLKYPENVIATYTKEIPSKELLEKVEFKIQSAKNVVLEQKEGKIAIRAKKNAKMTLVPTEELKDKVLFIAFKNKFNRGCHHGKSDQTITINGTVNKLTCRDWKYHNQNYTFHYVLLSPEKLTITFQEAYYKLKDIEVLSIPISVFQERKEEVKKVKINNKKTKGDTIVGTVKVNSPSTIEIAIPYDKGFTINVDGKKVPYQESLQNGMSVKVKKGTHKLEITYEAPWKKLGILVSIFGIFSWIGLARYYQKKK